jgi:hypothetical protein
MTWKRSRGGAASRPRGSKLGRLAALGAVMSLAQAACLFETACSESYDCDSGEACIDGICAEDDGSGSYSDPGGTCLDAGESCGTTSDCCGSALCVDYDGYSVCADQCSSDSGCYSGCCAPTSSGNLVCSAPDYC